MRIRTPSGRSTSRCHRAIGVAHSAEIGTFSSGCTSERASPGPAGQEAGIHTSGGHGLRLRVQRGRAADARHGQRFATDSVVRLSADHVRDRAVRVDPGAEVKDPRRQRAARDMPIERGDRGGDIRPERRRSRPDQVIGAAEAGGVGREASDRSVGRRATALFGDRRGYCQAAKCLL